MSTTTYDKDLAQDEEEEDRLFNREEAAWYLGVHKKTLSHWARTGKYQLPFVRVGYNLVRYKKSDLDRWIAERTRTQG